MRTPEGAADGAGADTGNTAPTVPRQRPAAWTIGRVNLSPAPAPAPAADPARTRFLQRLGEAARAHPPEWKRVLLSAPQGGEPGLLRVQVRPILLRGEPHLSFVFSHATRDLTRNLPVEAGLDEISALLGHPFRSAHLESRQVAWQLTLSRKGRGHLSSHATGSPGADATPAAAPGEGLEPAAHDRAKQRWLELDRPFLHALGVSTAQGALVPAMARKWRQINKFVEIFAHALDEAGLSDRQGLRVTDFGAGRAYLTFAVHDWLTHVRGLEVDVRGVELRASLVDEANATIGRLGLKGLRLEQGDLRDPPDATPSLDVMIALHACDVATDQAIHLGLRAGARVILCSPCCHQQIRPQLLSPHPLRSVFQHGIHAEQQAEMITDSLRALLLESRGYDTRVFEFVSLEHTRKNKMILAVKRRESSPVKAAGALAQVAELKRFFGVKEHCLETLLARELESPRVG